MRSSFRTMTLSTALLICSMIVLSRSSPLDSSSKEEIDSKDITEIQAALKPMVVLNSAFNKPSQKIVRQPKKCAKRHDICRLYGPMPLPCCEGLSCRVVYGEFHCFAKWELPSS